MQQTIRKLLITTSAVLGAILLAMPMAEAQTTQNLSHPSANNWPSYGRDPQMTRFSPLTQIGTSNVANLQQAWKHDLNNTYHYEGSPAEYDGVLYILSPDRVTALDATNGQLKWVHKFKVDQSVLGNLNGRVMRGSVVVYNGNVYATVDDGRVVDLNAGTGAVVWSTQVGKKQYLEGFSSGPIFADGKLIVGPSGADAGGVDGRIVALDPSNGKVLWTFHTIPQPGQPNFDTWKPASAAKWGGGSAWTPGAYDPSTKTLVYGIGNPIPVGTLNNNGKKVRSGKNLYTDSWVGLDINNGKLKWYYQVTPNDAWDADEHPTPIIAPLNLKGQTQDTAILAATEGYLILNNASTGKFLDAYKMMPQTNILKGFKADGTPIIDNSLRYKKPGGTVEDCAFRWVNYEPAAYSPVTKLYYRPNNDLCSQMTNHPLPSNWQPGQKAFTYSLKSQPDKFSRVGALSAIDPTTGKVVWHFDTGYSQYLGPVVTRGGLVFSGFIDRHFRAFDAKSGKVLWQQTLPSLIASEPITYEVNGKQYVAIVDGGNSGGSYQSSLSAPVQGNLTVYAFALPSGG